MLTLAKLFGKSPFAPLQTHLEKVGSCVDELPVVFEALKTQDAKTLKAVAEKIFLLEHEADITKNDIRNHLPKNLFLPIDRGSLLEILSLQDAIADNAEEIAVHSTFRPLPTFLKYGSIFSSFCTLNLEAFSLAKQTIGELDELLEFSFGGIEAQKVKKMVEKIALQEHEVTKTERKLLGKLYSDDAPLSPSVFHLTLTIVEQIGHIARLSEKLGNRIRMLLELK